MSEKGNRSVLITGPFGAVGMSVMKNFIKRNSGKPESERVQITCIARPSKRSKTNWAKLTKLANKEAVEFTTVWGDLSDKEAVENAVKGQQAVIHLAAIIPPMVHDDPKSARKVNVDATRSLVEICSKQEKPPRIVYGSSYAIWGPRNPHKEASRLDSRVPVDPQDAYGSQKYKAEKIVEQYCGEWTILRIGAVAITAEDILNYPNRTETLRILTYAIPANQRRHGLHHEDAGHAFAECAVTTKPVSGKLLPLGGDETWCVRASDFSGCILDAMGIGALPTDCYRKPQPELDEAFFFEDWMDTSETQALLNFQQRTFEDYKKELRRGMSSPRRVMLLLRPVVRRSLIKDSPYYIANRKGMPHPHNTKSVGELLKSFPEPEDSA